MQLSLTKTYDTQQRIVLVAGCPDTEQYLKKLAVDELLLGDFVRPRNPKFHRKFMAMMKIAFDMWEPVPIEIPKGSGRYITPTKDFDEFRKMIVVQSGFYNIVGYPDDSARLRAQSISFAKMSEDKFENLYSRALDQVLVIPRLDWPRKKFEKAVDDLMGFA